METKKIIPSKEEVIDYMNLHNLDEAGIDDQWDEETARYHLELSDEYYYRNKEANKK